MVVEEILVAETGLVAEGEIWSWRKRSIELATRYEDLL